DLAGTIAHAPDLPDPEVDALLGGVPVHSHVGVQAKLRALPLVKTGWEALTMTDDHLFDLADTDAGADAIVAAWKHAIATYPAAYAAHRLAVFERAISWNGPKPNFVTPAFENGPLLATVGEFH